MVLSTIRRLASRLNIALADDKLPSPHVKIKAGRIIVAFEALERWQAMRPPEWCQVTQIRVVHRRGYSSDLKIQDKQACHHERIVQARVASAPSQTLCRVEGGQRQGVLNTNAARLGDSCPSFRILQGHPSEPDQILCFVVRQPVSLYQGGHLVEAIAKRVEKSSNEQAKKEYKSLRH